MLYSDFTLGIRSQLLVARQRSGRRGSLVRLSKRKIKVITWAVSTRASELLNVSVAASCFHDNVD